MSKGEHTTCVKTESTDGVGSLSRRRLLTKAAYVAPTVVALEIATHGTALGRSGRGGGGNGGGKKK